MVDWRKVNRPHDHSPIRVNITPQALHKAVDRPPAADGQKWPTKVMWRGYWIECTGKVKATDQPRGPLKDVPKPYAD
jgi:hypothetical protein